MKHVSGFVSILGRPNAGKSTLLNALCGHKLAIVSDKPQTTRTAVQGVVTEPEAQIIFLDTPGIHQGNTLFNKRMMEVVRGALQDRDVLLFLDDCMHPLTDTFLSALDLLEGVKTPALLALNKIDALDDKRQLLPRIERYRERFAFAEYLPISAQTGEGLDKLKATIISRLPEGPEYFPPDFVTDQPERFLAGEIIREKILDATRQEVPHSVAVFVENWEDTPKLLRIAATVYVERPGQKAIIIGAKGSMLRKVGTLAREDLERMFSRKIFLELFVKVRPNWRESREFLNEIDWHSMAGVELESEENPLETDLQ